MSDNYGFSEIAYNIMKKRILFDKDNGETEKPEDAFRRAANHVAQGHIKYETKSNTTAFIEKAVIMMCERKFMPNTPTLVNAGYPNAQCSACFVLPVDDNLPSIYKAYYDQGLIQASGGGTGLYLGNVRSSGSLAGGRLITKGPINWLYMYNENANRVAQGMRKGANMAILNIEHPDIIDFITCKKIGYDANADILAKQFKVSLEKAKEIKANIGIENFNLSVSVNDRFMLAVENNENWYLVDPHSGERKGSILATELFNLIVNNAHKHGEPGLFFVDTANKFNTIPQLGKINATNPCVTGDTLIQTDRGLERISKFVRDAREDAKVIGKSGQWRGVRKFMNNGIKPVWQITTNSGYTIKATEYHKFPVENRGDVQLKNLKIGDVLYLQHHNVFDYINNSNDSIEYEYLEWAVNIMGTNSIDFEYRRVPESVWTASEQVVKAFIRGLFNAAGDIRVSNSGVSIVLSSENIDLLRDTQILFSMFGCMTSILDRSKHPGHMVSDYNDKSYELFLHSDAKSLFVNEIGFTNNSNKQDKLNKILTGNDISYKSHINKDFVVSIEYVGEEEVFDITVDDTDLSMVNNGIITIDCGEQPLLPYESCTLAHLNLGKFVIGTNGTSQVNWSDFEDAIRFGTQFLDAVVEVNSFPIPELDKLNRGTRRIGLGIMGWADMLAQMRIPYDSEEAIVFADEIGSFFDNISLDECRKLGKDRGNFPLFDNSIFNGVEEYMRCSNRTTIAPTGSTSIYAMCSSGIEPLFAPVMVRNHAGLIQVDYHPVLFDILNDRDLDNIEIRDKLARCGSIRNAQFLPDDIRNIFPTAHDINYTWHIKHQIAWQKHITSAVSKTINLPSDASTDDVAKAYMMAWKGGCKGITVYRDGARKDQPIESKKEKKISNNICVGRRSPVTHGSNRKISTGCGNLMVYVGGDNETLQDVTARLGKGGGCASALNEAIARMASIAIQYGASPELVIRQLSGTRCHLQAYHKGSDGTTRQITSCSDAIAVAISEHVLENTSNTITIDSTINHSGACPECGGQINYSEGCSKCYNCGFSRC